MQHATRECSKQVYVCKNNSQHHVSLHDSAPTREHCTFSRRSPVPTDPPMHATMPQCDNATMPPNPHPLRYFHHIPSLAPT